MPHFVIEYARSMEKDEFPRRVMDIAFQTGARSGVMKPEDIKVRAIAYDHMRFEGAIETFVHVTVSLLAGRTDAQKEHVANLLRQDLATAFPNINSISIDVRDMNPVAYKKRLLPQHQENA